MSVRYEVESERLRFFETCARYRQTIRKNKTLLTEWYAFQRGPEMKRVLDEVVADNGLYDLNITLALLDQSEPVSHQLRTGLSPMGFNNGANVALGKVRYAVRCLPRMCQTAFRRFLLGLFNESVKTDLGGGDHLRSSGLQSRLDRLMSRPPVANLFRTAHIIPFAGNIAFLLFHRPRPKAPLSLMVDASTVAVGAVLQQHINDSTRPLAFFSKKLSLAETRYSTFGRELLAIYLAVKHFGHFLEGRDFTIFTDHKPLTFATRSHSDKYNPSEISHLDYISQFTNDIRHIDCPKNAVADMLSRFSLSEFYLSPSWCYGG
nr:unnamed protein product [Spirometra erinaceieuropaei]